MAGADAAGDRLDRRALNRATLARQLLLGRVELSVAEAAARLGGLNAQDVEPPYLSLWARLAGFERDALTRALEDRAVVRGVLLRGTQHVVTADDYLAWRPLLQPVMDRFGRGALGRAGTDREALAAAARRHLDGRRLTRRKLARLLAAFGPASVADIQAWSGLTRLREVVDRLRPRLRRFRDERGQQLYDLPDAPRPDPGVPSPVRFLPPFDNLLLAHADRARVMTDEVRRRVCVGAVVEVEPPGRLAGPEREAVAGEGLRLLRFAATDTADHDVRGGVGERRRPPSARQGRRQFSRQSEPTGAISAP